MQSTQTGRCAPRSEGAPACSMARFEPGELGTPFPEDELPPHLQAARKSAARFQGWDLTPAAHKLRPPSPMLEQPRPSSEKPCKPKDLARPRLLPTQQAPQPEALQGPQLMVVDLSQAPGGLGQCGLRGWGHLWGSLWLFSISFPGPGRPFSTNM